MGDLNALARSDYSAEEWSVLEKRAAENGWGSPVDSKALGDLKANNLVDLFAQQRGVQKDLGSVRGLEKFTAHGCYRIDYMWANEAFLELFKPVAASVRAEVPWSDHFPLCIDVAIRNGTKL